MRYRFSFQTRADVLPAKYRELMLSFFKNALQSYEEGRYFEHFYGSGASKKYTFAVRFPSQSKFSGDKIILNERRFDLFFSTADSAEAILFYNAMLTQKRRPYKYGPEDEITLVGIGIETEKVIASSEIICKAAMPIIAREHNRESNKDRYYSVGSERFSEVLMRNIRFQLDAAGFDLSCTESLELEWINPKKTVVRHKDILIECTIGTFRLKGAPQVLTYLYEAGISAKKGFGFGYFNIL